MRYPQSLMTNLREVNKKNGLSLLCTSVTDLAFPQKKLTNIILSNVVIYIFYRAS